MRLGDRFALWMRRKRIYLARPMAARPPRRRAFSFHRRRGGDAGRLRRIFAGIIILALVLLLIGNYYVRNHFRPLMAQMATVEVDILATRLINQAIMNKIADEGITYNTLIYFEKDASGQIAALQTDVVSINRIRTDITEDVVRHLAEADTSGLYVPVGNLISTELFGGRGPRIPIKIVPLGTARTNFSNQFSAAGINQTRHQIMLDVAVDINILFPGHNVGTEVFAEVVVAETIIVGAVPETFLTVDDMLRR